MEMVLQVVGVLVLVGTGAAYMTLRAMLKDLVLDFGQLASLTYAFMTDVVDHQEVDFAMADKIRMQIEDIWVEVEEMGPMVKKILDLMPKSK
jgi:hypothetical protein